MIWVDYRVLWGYYGCKCKHINILVQGKIPFIWRDFSLLLVVAFNWLIHGLSFKSNNLLADVQSLHHPGSAEDIQILSLFKCFAFRIFIKQMSGHPSKTYPIYFAFPWTGKDAFTFTRKRRSCLFIHDLWVGVFPFVFIMAEFQTQYRKIILRRKPRIIFLF